MRHWTLPPTEISRHLLLALLFLLPVFGAAQSISALKSKRQKLEREVALTNKLLEQTESGRKKSYGQLRLLKEKVRLQEKLVYTIDEELQRIDERIEQLGGLISAIEYDIEGLQKSLNKVLRVAYRAQGRSSSLLWVLSAGSFRQAFSRIAYFKAFARFRVTQLRMLRRARNALLENRTDYQAQKAEKEKLLKVQRDQTKKLERAKSEKDKLYRSLKRKERTYKNQLSRYQKSIEQLKDQITALIRASQAKAKTQAEKDKIFKLSGAFAKNKRRLPWPIPMPSAIITGDYGKQKDATGGEVFNEGLYFSTAQGQSIRAIFSGKVTMISEIPSLGKVVIVQHGEYRTVYANLGKVLVSQGTEVQALQTIGTVRTDSKTGETQLYFQLYNGFEPVNPAVWLAPK